MDSHFKCNRKEEKTSAGVAEAFSWSVIVAVGESVGVALGEPVGVDVSGQQTAQPTNGIFDAAFLPGSVRVTEVSLQSEGHSSRFRATGNSFRLNRLSRGKPSV